MQINKKNIERFREDASLFLVAVETSKSYHPTKLLCEVMSKVYGHQVSTQKLAMLIEESPITKRV